MKTGHLLAWLSAAAIGVGFGAVPYCFAAETGITVSAATGQDSTDSGLSYTYDTAANEAGTTAVFTVTAEGTGLTYQWQYYNTETGKWTDLTAAGSTKARLEVTAAAGISGRKFRCVIKNSLNNKVYSGSAILTVT